MFPQLDISGVRTQSVQTRRSKMQLAESARPFKAEDGSFSAFVAALPSILKSADLKEFVRGAVAARQAGRPFVFMMGAHVIKVGLAPLVIDLMETGFITHVAMNSAGAIHDSESALFGVTSEDVATNLRDGSFGMWKETGDFINGTLTRDMPGAKHGFGEALGLALHDADAPYLSHSILAAGVRLAVPVSVHAAIGTDIVHQQPGMDGAATGEMSFRDFRVLCHELRDLQDGVVVNMGSAVILPEVFLKALTVVRNLGHSAAGFAAANFDMIQHYRPHQNVVTRPTLGSGRGYSFTGHHEIMLPLLAAMLKLFRAEAAHG